MLSKPVFTTQKLNIHSSDKSFVLAVPNLFSSAVIGDVYLFDLSIELVASVSSQKGLLQVTIVNGYTQNGLGSSLLMNVTQDSETKPVFLRFSPVIFTVIEDGVNPLDQGVVHLAVEFVSGDVTDIEVTAKALWHQVEKVSL